MLANRNQTKRKILLGLSALGVLLVSGSCSTEEVKPLPALPEVPEFVGLPHPEGIDRADLLAVFRAQQAPKEETLRGCEEPFTKLKAATNSIEEIETGARELVLMDPVKMHWCFYWKIHELDASTADLKLVRDKQKVLIETFTFLAPLARTYKKDYNDTRYIRYAIHQYKKYSNLFFYRSLELTPEAKQEYLAGVDTPASLLVRQPEVYNKSVLEKYKIIAPKEALATGGPPEIQATQPADPDLEEPKESASSTDPAPVDLAPVAPPPVENTTRAPASE